MRDVHVSRRAVLAMAAMSFANLNALSRAIAAQSAKNEWARVRALIQSYVDQRKIAGAIVGVSYDGAPMDFLAAGSPALNSAAPVDENTIWRIYSMTKPVTGIAAMMLVEDGLIELDQPVREVIPEFAELKVAVRPDEGLEARPARTVMTMRHLITHSGGFAYWTPLSKKDALSEAYRARGITPGNVGAGLHRPGYGPQVKDLAKMIEQLAGLPLAYDPGTAYRYSVGLDVMGAVIERVTGKGFDVFLQSRLFTPLEMSSTAFRIAPKDVGRLSTNYQVTPGGLEPLDQPETSAWLGPPNLLSGGGGLLSTARDYTRFGSMLLGEGELDGVRVMKSNTVRLALSNLLPRGITRDGGGSGAGGRIVLVGGTSPFAPPGSFGHGGAAGTNWWIEPARLGQVVFMTQHMPPNAYPIAEELQVAVNLDLGRRS